VQGQEVTSPTARSAQQHHVRCGAWRLATCTALGQTATRRDRRVSAVLNEGIFPMKHRTIKPGPPVGSWPLDAYPPWTIKGRTLVTLGLKPFLGISGSARQYTYTVDVGCYAPAARTTLNPCVFFVFIHLRACTTGSAPQSTLTSSFSVRRVCSTTRLGFSSRQPCR
jgi:hypothetical protein